MTTDLTVPGDSTPAPYDAPAVPAISRDILRPRLPEIGRIRLGKKVPTTGGKLRPAKIEAFRFTSRNKAVIEHVAAQYGGECEPWDSEEGHQWQVFTPATEIDVVIPRAQLAFSQYFELWSGGGLCERRCNGIRQTNDAPCACSPDHENVEGECKITTRLSVFLPDIPGLGLWRIESHGWNAGAEIQGTLELAAAFGIDLLPGTLTAESRGPRRIKDRNGKPTTVKYVVPVLTIDQSIRQAVARLQLVQQQRLGIMPSSNDRASERSMRGLRAAVFSRWPESAKPGPERDRRLAQLSAMIGHDVDTISNDHDLTEGEALRLAHLVDSLPDPQELQAAPDSGPAAGPLAPEHPGPANISAESATVEPPTGALAAAGPAEHHSDEELGEVPSPEGPEGGVSDMTATPPSGPAPARSLEAPVWPTEKPAAPIRKRRRTDPGGAPSVAQARKELAERKNAPAPEPEADNPLHYIPSPKFRTLYVSWFENQAGGDWGKGMEDCRRHAQAHLDRLRATGWMGKEFTRPQLEAMAAETFESQP